MRARLAFLPAILVFTTACPDDQVNADAAAAADAAPSMDAHAADAIGQDAIGEDASEDDAGAGGDAAEADASPGDAEAFPDAAALCGNRVLEGGELCDDGPNNTDTPCTPAIGAITCTYCDTECAPHDVQGVGRIEGKVLSFTQWNIGTAEGAYANPIAQFIVTDELSRFTVDPVPAADRVAVTAFAPYSRNGVSFSVTTDVVRVGHGETVSITPQLIEGCSQTETVGPTMGAVFDTENACPTPLAYARATLTLEADGVIDNSGAPFAGQTTCDLFPWPVPFSRAGALFDFFEALPADGMVTRLDTTREHVESLGALQIGCGPPVRPSPGHAMTVTFPRTNHDPAGTIAPFASLDSSNGTWIELPDVATATVVGGEDAWQADVPGSGIYIAFAPKIVDACVRGVLNVDPPAIGPMMLRAASETSGTTQMTTTDGAGAFCVDVPSSEPILLSARYALAVDPRFWSIESAVRPIASGSSCATPRMCFDASTLMLAPVNPACASARLFWNDGSGRAPYVDQVLIEYDVPDLPPGPIADAKKSHVYLGKTTPAIDGSACLQLPTDGNTTLTTTQIGQFGSPCTLTLGALSANAGVCGIDETGCEALGELDFDCGSP